MNEQDAEWIARGVHDAWAALVRHLGPAVDLVFEDVDVGLSDDGHAVAFRDADGVYMVKVASDGQEAAFRYRLGADGFEDVAMFRDGQLVNEARIPNEVGRGDPAAN